jgi:hypothetical protein
MRHDKTIPPLAAITKLKKQEKVALLIEVVERYNARPVGHVPAVSEPQEDAQGGVEDVDHSDDDLESDQELYH